MEAAMTDAASRVQELLERIATDSGVEAEVRVHEDEEGVTGEFVGDDLGLLIGHHGQTIDAIQHVAYRIAFRGAPPASGSWSTPPAIANAAPWRCEPPPTRPPRPPSTTAGRSRSRR